MPKATAIMTPTTHWDREWVMTFGQYQVRLVNLIDRLLPIMEKNPEYRFLLDGQAIVLEDYLEIKPEERVRLGSLLQSGRLVTGPWYVLADQFLQNGESTIRNLLLGMKMIRELGGRPMMLGYVPDSFGSIATLPMLLQGFGIRYATFGRGRPYWGEGLPQFEFWWESPDGSRILTANHAYGSGIFLSYPDIYADIMHPDYDPLPETVFPAFMSAADSQLELSVSSNLYFSIGVDHMDPRETLPNTIKYINSHQDQYELVYGTPEHYMERVERDARDLVTYSGEMRGSEDNLMDLVGTLSSHMPLKQANDYCETLLQRVLEPLAVMHSNLAGAAYPIGHLRKLWKLLLHNHPHDSICGCSLDQVHLDMRNRFEQIEHTGNYLLKEMLHALQAEIDLRHPDPEAIAVTVFNPLGRTHTGPVQTLVRVPKRFKHNSYSLMDENGSPVAAKIDYLKEKQKDLETVYMTNELLAAVLSKEAPAAHRDDQVFTMLRLDFVAKDVPSMGYRTWWLKPAEADPESLDDAGAGVGAGSGAVRLADNGMENETLRVEFHTDGTLDLLDKRTNYRYSGLNHFVDREDIGNGYDHHSLDIPQDYDSRQCLIRWEAFDVCAHRITYKAEFHWNLPEQMGAGQRSSHFIDMPVTLYATLYAGVPRLEIKVELDNICRDHAIRAVFNTGLDTRVSTAYDHYNVLERPVRQAGKEWRDDPFQQFVDISDGIHGLAISTRGLPAYEAIQGDKGAQLLITLLRSVGQIGPAAGANHPAPGSQCQGKQVFEYALMPHTGNWLAGDCLGNSTDYRSPLLAEADLPHSGKLPAVHSLLQIKQQVKHSNESSAPFLSCLKQAEDGKGSVLRLWNPTEATSIQLDSSLPFQSISITSLDETDRQPIASAIPTIPLPAYGLTTILFHS